MRLSVNLGAVIFGESLPLLGQHVLPAKIGCRRGYVILIVRQVIGGLQPTEGAEIVELVVAPANSSLFARGVEIAGIGRKRDGKLVVPRGVVRLTTPLAASAP